MIEPTVLRGFSDEYGSWKIICISRRSAFSSSPLMSAISRPSNLIEPPVGLHQPQQQPRGGRLAAAGLAHEPERLAAHARRSEMPSTAWTAPTWRWKNPAWIGKCLTRPSTSMIFSPARRAAAPHLQDAHTAFSSMTSSRAASRLDAVAQLAPQLAAHARSPAGTRPRARRRRARARASDRSSCAPRARTGSAGGTSSRPAGVISDGGRPGDRHELLVARRVQPRDRGQQAPRVGMLGRREDRVGVGLLDDPAGVHDRDLVGHLGHHAEVVGDDDDGGVELALQPLDQLEDLRLDGHVERGRRLVGDQQLRVVGQRHRDHRALAHAARELVRVGVGALARLRDADQREHLDRAVPGLRLRDVAGAPARPRRSARPTL